MNILIPDSWLREFLKTSATPKQIKEYVSLCGPSIERIHQSGGEAVYDVEVTTNRPDSMSVVGVAREASVILPRFGIKASLIGNPYISHQRLPSASPAGKKLHITTDPALNPRWTSIVLENVSVKPSPKWLADKLEKSSIRPLNTIVDITNYLMRAYGQPAHAFDFDAIAHGKNSATMILRASKKGEKLTTLDGKTHTLPGGDIVIVDGKGKLIDLCGIMGAKNSSITQKTKTIVLFLQTYDPVHIRKTSMALAHRTEAAGLFEKGIDSELVMPALREGIRLVEEFAGGTPASPVYNLYPKTYKPYSVTVSREKVDAYLGVHLSDRDSLLILTSLGFVPIVTKKDITVRVPSFRRDVTLDVDIIEELARIYGYHTIQAKLPASAPPVVIPDPMLHWEEEIKTRLRDWGYTETYTYSMISEKLMDTFALDKTKAYNIQNPLSEDWVYMRPSLWPSMLTSLAQNLNIRQTLALFELSMVYRHLPHDLPEERPTLIVAWSGEQFRVAKGLAQAFFQLLGIPFPNENGVTSSTPQYGPVHLSLGHFGSLGLVESGLLTSVGIKGNVTILELDVGELVKVAKPNARYVPIPKYPPSFEDIAFVFPPKTPIGPVLTAVGQLDPMIADVTLLDTHGDTKTLHVTYLSKTENLTGEDVRPIREKILHAVKRQFGGELKTS